MHPRESFTIAMVVVTAAACSDQPTGVEAPLQPGDAHFARGGVQADELGTLATTIENLTATLSNIELTDAGLVGDVLLTNIETEQVLQLTDVPLSLLDAGDGGRTCDILFLDVGPIDLNLLGLDLSVSQITVDLDAQSGAGNLLGNLLCAVAHLLDGDGPLTAINDLIDQINNLLG